MVEKLEPQNELIKMYQELEELTNTLGARIQHLVSNAQKTDKDFRKLIYDKELSQILSGFAQLQRIRLDILKELNKQPTENNLETLMALLESNALEEELPNEPLNESTDKPIQ